MVKALAIAMAASGAESDGSDDSGRYSVLNYVLISDVMYTHLEKVS